MQAAHTGHSPDELYAIAEVAGAAGVSRRAVLAQIENGRAIAFRGYLARPDAVDLVRRLAGRRAERADDKAPISLLRAPRRSTGPSLALSGFAHLVALALLATAATLGWLNAADTEQPVIDRSPVRLVYLMTPGPGGGGGGGGVRIPAPPPPAKRKPPVKLARAVSSPVPPPRRTPPPRPTPPRPVRPMDPPRLEPRVEPTPVPPPPMVPPAVQAPVVSQPADPIDQQGSLNQTLTPPAPSNGPGSGGGVGSGSGTGLGEGNGGGIGPGSGGGTGGGPLRPGSGITPPTLIREVRPTYTPDARRQAIEGEVVLEIVVQRDGTVGGINVVRTLGAGLEQKAIEAVRQWRFGPARRQGVPVDVVVEVSVAFTLR